MIKNIQKIGFVKILSSKKTDDASGKSALDWGRLNCFP